MSERIRQSVMISLFRSNRFVIAACAAIAMVLGAMSVGASINHYPEITPQANITTVIDGQGSSTPKPQPVPGTEDNDLPGQVQSLKVQPLINAADTTNQSLNVKNVPDNTLKKVTLFIPQSTLIDQLRGIQAAVDNTPLAGSVKVTAPALTPVLAEPSSAPLPLELVTDPDQAVPPEDSSNASPVPADPATPELRAAPDKLPPTSDID